eukprot:5940040-Prorocentrum_lima.AAC.1
MAPSCSAAFRSDMTLVRSRGSLPARWTLGTWAPGSRSNSWDLLTRHRKTVTAWINDLHVDTTPVLLPQALAALPQPPPPGWTTMALDAIPQRPRFPGTVG